ncbi:general substrate transporter [Trichoderma velutinum]
MSSHPKEEIATLDSRKNPQVTTIAESITFTVSPTETVPPDHGAINVLLILSCLAFGAASFLFGYDDKVISSVAATEYFVKRFQGHPNPASGEFALTARNQDLVFSVPLVGSIVGGLATAPLSSRYGRKWALLGSYCFSFLGSFLQLFAPNLATFAISRIFTDFVIGIAHTIAPLYLCEVVPTSMRGRSVSIYNILNLVSGVVSTIIVNSTYTMDNSRAYQIPLSVQAGLPVLLLLLSHPIPESPQWLVAKGCLEEAKHNLRRLRGYTNWQLEDEFRVIVLCEENERELTATVRIRDLFNSENLRRTITVGSFYSLNQISGVILSTMYTTVFLSQLGIGNAFVFTVIVSCCTLAGTIFSPTVIDIYGRRPIALTCMMMLFIIDIAAGILTFFSQNDRALLAIAALGFIFNFFWAVSFLSISVILPPEIATPKLRSLTVVYTVACAHTTAVITTFAVPQLTDASAAGLGAKTYLVFAGCMACIIVWSFFLMLETKGRTYAEIDEMYDQKIPMWKWSSFETVTQAKQPTSMSRKAINDSTVISGQ